MPDALSRDDIASCDDIALTELPRMDQSLLRAIRAWVMGRRVGEDMGAKIDSVFRHTGVTEAAQPLEGFLWGPSQGLSRTLQVNRTCQARVSPNEARRLSLFSLLGEDRTDAAETLPRSFASERATLLSADCAMRVVLRFRAAAGGSDMVRSSPGVRRAGRVVPMGESRTHGCRLH